MKAERLFRVLGLVNPELTEEATRPIPRRKTAWSRWGTLAACLVVMLGLGWLYAGDFNRSGGSSGSGCIGGSTAGGMDPGESGAGGSGIEDGITFMSYAGPVLPLTTVEDASGLTAEREILWDFAPDTFRDGSPRQWGVNVTDTYVIHNSTDTDISVTALYPFAGSFYDLAKLRPSVTVDGAANETTLYAGVYSGGFQSTFGAEVPDTMNLSDLDSWQGYKALLESGEYLVQALGDYPVLDVPVTVYEFSDFQAPLEKYNAATQTIRFEISEEETQIFTYGFNGMDWDDGFRRYGYFVPNGMRNEPDLKLLIVLGNDIEDYALQGYKDGGCRKGEEIKGVSCSVSRSETTLDAVLDRLCQYHKARYIQGLAADQDNAFDEVPFTIYRGAAAELLTGCGVLSEHPMDRYCDGRLEDVLSETLSHDRVLYLSFPVTIPASGSVTVSCTLWKPPSFDYACSGSEHAGLQGCDLMTRLGSTLEFTSQRAVLANTGGIRLAGQNFGFDLENGVSSVELDLNQEHYYMELRAREE